MVMRQYCGYVESYAITTDGDLHGDKITPEAIDSLCKQIDENPSRRVLNRGHDSNQRIGDIVEWRVDSKGDWRGLWVKIGVYEGCEGVLAQMQSGEMGGLSIEAYSLEEGTLGVSGDGDFSANTYRMKLEVRPDLRHEVAEELKDERVETRGFIRKAVDIPAIIEKAVDISAIIEIAADSTDIVPALYGLWKILRDRERETEPVTQQSVNIFNIVIGDQTLNFEQNNVEHIIQLLEQTRDNGDDS